MVPRACEGRALKPSSRIGRGRAERIPKTNRRTKRLRILLKDIPCFFCLGGWGVVRMTGDDSIIRQIWMVALLAAMFGLKPAILSAALAPSVGNLAPEFALLSQEGTSISLKGYRGKARWPRYSPR